MSTIKQIKELLCVEIAKFNTKIAANKIQLKDVFTGFLKDAMTLASYNINYNVTLEMSLRSRGGKK